MYPNLGALGYGFSEFLTNLLREVKRKTIKQLSHFDAHIVYLFLSCNRIECFSCYQYSFEKNLKYSFEGNFTNHSKVSSKLESV